MWAAGELLASDEAAFILECKSETCRCGGFINATVIKGLATPFGAGKRLFTKKY
jgi:hypothetical protein